MIHVRGELGWEAMMGGLAAQGEAGDAGKQGHVHLGKLGHCWGAGDGVVLAEVGSSVDLDICVDWNLLQGDGWSLFFVEYIVVRWPVE